MARKTNSGVSNQPKNSTNSWSCLCFTPILSATRRRTMSLFLIDVRDKSNYLTLALEKTAIAASSRLWPIPHLRASAFRMVSTTLCSSCSDTWRPADPKSTCTKFLFGEPLVFHQHFAEALLKSQEYGGDCKRSIEIELLDNNLDLSGI
jgi:hypothetical protein